MRADKQSRGGRAAGNARCARRIRRIERPVKWIGDRSEDFMASVHGRDSLVRARLALDRDGKFLALEAKILANMGAYVSTVAPVVPTMAMGSAMGGVYDIPLVAFQTSGVFTNTTPVDAYRGAGKPEANYLVERCIDIAAARVMKRPMRRSRPTSLVCRSIASLSGRAIRMRSTAAAGTAARGPCTR